MPLRRTRSLAQIQKSQQAKLQFQQQEPPQGTSIQFVPAPLSASTSRLPAITSECQTSNRTSNFRSALKAPRRASILGSFHLDPDSETSAATAATTHPSSETFKSAANQPRPSLAQETTSSTYLLKTTNQKNATSKMPQGSSSDSRTKQHQSSHMLKTGRRGNPFAKDTHDLFATLMVSLELKNNSKFFRTYPNSFTTDDAAVNLASLRFSQSNRTVDPNDSARIITTTTTTTFSMSRDIAKGICQHFMDARLIENAADHMAVAFKERGIFQITPKGLHVLERFITRNGIASDNLVKVFVSQPMCMKLLNLERNLQDDDIVISTPIIESVFRRFAGARQPNYIIDPTDIGRSNTPRPFADNARPQPGFDRSLGVELQDVSEKTGRSGPLTVYKQVFSSQAGVDWLLDFSSCVCRDEAAEILGHFVRLGLIVLHADRSKSGDRLVIVEVKSDSDSGLRQAEFRWGTRVTYRITEEGRKLATASQKHAAAAEEAEAKASGASDSRSKKSSDAGADRDFLDPMGSALADAVDRQHLSPRQLRDIFNSDDWNKESQSSTNRLRAILEVSSLRGMFREYLRSNYCDENLGFWLDVSEFRRRFSTTSSASGGRAASKGATSAGATSAMEVHQQHLVAAAMQIYHTYLAPMSPNELNIDHNLRGDVVNFIQKAQLDNAANGDTPVQMKKLTPSADNSPDGGEVVPTIALRATQVQTLLRHYERIQDHIFRLLATDQVPKFIRGPKFQALLKNADQALDQEIKGDASKSSTSLHAQAP